MAVLGMQVVVDFEHDNLRGAFPRTVFVGPKIDNNLIKAYLQETREDIEYDVDSEEPEHDMVFYADEIRTLLLIIVDLVEEEPYFEVLDPYKFWPYKESKAHAVKRAKYRGKKGGEK